MLGHGVGDEHRREQFTQLTGELRMGRRHPLGRRVGVGAVHLRQLVDERGEQLLVGRGEWPINGAGAGKSGGWHG